VEPLTERYRPRNWDDLIGQPEAVRQLKRFVAAPHPAAFLFEGPTGVGKTSAARVLATALGVDVESGGMGGYHCIAAGEQTGRNVRDAMSSLEVCAWSGSGWRVLVVNEADAMTPQASFVWLDALEELPPQAVVIFTTNNPGKLTARLRDRCERVKFTASADTLRPYLQGFVDRIWKAETGDSCAPAVASFGPIEDERGRVSFRRLLQQMTPVIRARQQWTAAEGNADEAGNEDADDGSAKPARPDELLERFDELVQSLARRFHRWAGIDVDDYAQELRVQVIRYWSRYDPKRGGFATWIRRLALDAARRAWYARHRVQFNTVSAHARHRDGQELDSPDGLLGRCADPDAADPADEAAQNEIVDRVRAAVAALPAGQRSAVISRANGDDFVRPRSEAKAIRSRYRAGLDSLRDKLLSTVQQL
jgi:RNA polymerase sigma factor (sigma-70 family)